MTGENFIDPLHQRITGFEVRGHERDTNEHWVGADLQLIINRGRFFVNIVTKAHFANEHLRDTLAMPNDPSELTESTAIETKPPFVINDVEITDEVMERKFKNRIVEEDLAASLWYEGPVEENHS